MYHTAGMGQAAEGQIKKEAIEDRKGPGSITLNVLTDPQSSINTVQQDGPDSRGIRQRPGQCGTDRQNDIDYGLKPGLEMFVKIWTGYEKGTAIGHDGCDRGFEV